MAPYSFFLTQKYGIYTLKVHGLLSNLFTIVSPFIFKGVNLNE
jgi:hypothetical protein